jgi:hypothetical protein
MIAIQQLPSQKGSDKSGSAGYQEFHQGPPVTIEEKEISRSGFLFRQTAVMVIRKKPGSFLCSVMADGS